MPRKIITENMKEEVVKEAETILTDIHYKWFGECIHKKLPTFRIKLGGWTATTSKRLNEISLNYYSWNKSPLVVKKLILIHEMIHILGLKHSGVKVFCSTLDLLSFKIYIRLYGNDRLLKEFMDELDIGIDKITKKYMLLK